jgi:hypothetical protein
MKKLLLSTLAIAMIILVSCEKQHGNSNWPGGFNMPHITRHGGSLIYPGRPDSLVVSRYDIGYLDWNSAKAACESLVLNGYDDWDLPTLEELNSINRCRYNCDTVFVEDFYWSSTEDSNTTSKAYGMDFFLYGTNLQHSYDKRNPHFFRAVRRKF